METKKEKFNIKGTATITKRRGKKIISVHKYTNLFCLAGKYSILDRMTGESSKGLVTYLALGSDTTSPLASDVKLGTETFRKAITQRTRTGLIFYSSTFLTSAEANATFREMGLFGDDASSGADSGTMNTHLAINETKVLGETITVDYNIEILT